MASAKSDLTESADFHISKMAILVLLSSLYTQMTKAQKYSAWSVYKKWSGKFCQLYSWCNPQACFPAIQSKNSLPFPALFIQQHELHQRKGCHSHNLIVPKSRRNKFWTGSATQRPQAAPERALWSHNSVPKSRQKKFCCACPTPATQSAPKRAPPEPQYHPKSRQEKFCSVSGNTTNTNCTEER